MNSSKNEVNFLLILLAMSAIPTQPCQPSPCGTNTICREQNGVGSCYCLPEYIGNPYEGCRPECTIASDCPSHLACINLKCQNPCPGACGGNTNCQVINNLPVCICLPQYVGDPYVNCLYKLPSSKSDNETIGIHLSCMYNINILQSKKTNLTYADHHLAARTVSVKVLVVRRCALVWPNT